MANFTKYFEDQEESIDEFELDPLYDDYQFPEWLDGDFIISGPSKFGMENQKYNFLLDGFGRFSRFQIANGTV